MGLAESVLDEFGLDVQELKLVPSHGGVFEVSLDGQLIYSKKKTGRQPTVKEIKDILRSRHQ